MAFSLSGQCGERIAEHGARMDRLLCVNAECPDLLRHGVTPEFRRDVKICPACGTPLQPDAAAYDPPDGAGRRLARLPSFQARWYRARPLIDAHAAGWIIDTYSWFLSQFVGAEHEAQRVLVQPTDEFFPIQHRSEGRAIEIFEAVRSLAGMEDWPCRLEEQVERPDKLHPALIVVPEGDAALGTFSVPGEWGDGAVITYDPALVREPVRLIATFAHELTHYLLATSRSAPPGGESFEERATDLGAVFLGFGVFMANSAFEFRTYEEDGWSGWQVAGGGYLREDQLAFALALFLLVHGMEAERAAPYLDPNPRKYLKLALRQLAGAPEEVERLRAMHAAAEALSARASLDAD